jgi:hypothetical protein
MSDKETTVTTTVTTPKPEKPTVVVHPTAPGQPSPDSTITVPNVTRVTIPAKD